MNKSTSLTVAKQEQQIALASEVEAHRALTLVVTSLAGYQDKTGEGPNNDSLKGIMITVSRRITMRYGHKVQEMPTPMLRHVMNLKYALGDLVRALVAQHAQYKTLKESLWKLIDEHANEYWRLNDDATA